MTTDISVGVRWDPLNGANGADGNIEDYDFEYDGGNSSSRLFERSRIRALADEREHVQKRPSPNGSTVISFVSTAVSMISTLISGMEKC